MRGTEERTFTVEEYYKLAEIGILQPSERVELIDGHILRMAPISEPHATIVDRLNQLLVTQSSEFGVRAAHQQTWDERPAWRVARAV
jgi:Uma2 family endonuclease